MPAMPILLLITTNPHSNAAKMALITAKQMLTNNEAVHVFFYGDGAYTANRLMWQTADVANIQDEWVKLANQYSLDLPVCVSTALARGITDSSNAKRHQLDGDNLHPSFRLTGLSELVLMLNNDTKIMQF